MGDLGKRLENTKPAVGRSWVTERGGLRKVFSLKWLHNPEAGYWPLACLALPQSTTSTKSTKSTVHPINKPNVLNPTHNRPLTSDLA